MNIFVLDRDPVKAAHYHCDKHVVKMILESTQMLCTAHNILCREKPCHLCRDRPDGWMKSTHENHPCSKWVRESLMNYHWLHDLAEALCGEYTQRYHKRHKCWGLIIRLVISPHKIPVTFLTDFVQAMPEQYRRFDAVEAYRCYYRSKTFATWRHSDVPEWWSEKPDETRD
jgi:hypothetical protein